MRTGNIQALFTDRVLFEDWPTGFRIIDTYRKPLRPYDELPTVASDERGYIEQTRWNSVHKLAVGLKDARRSRSSRPAGSDVELNSSA